MEDDIRAKNLPADYGSDAIRVLYTMSFTKGKGVGLLGSMSLRSQQYAGDYDAFEIVNMKERTDEVALHMLATRFKEMMKEVRAIPNTYIGDIKAGSIEEWRVLPKTAMLENGKVVGMDVEKSKAVLDRLKRNNIISEKEYKESLSLLEGTITPMRLLEAKKELKFHIVRWTPPEVERGFKILKDKRRFTLEEAFSSPTITKMDVISLVQNNRYTDFSMIYYFRNKGTLLNPDVVDIAKSIKENIYYYTQVGNPFKALKRKFALAKMEKDASVITKLTPILNSDLGRIYHVLGDIGTLIHLLEDFKPDQTLVRFEIDQFRNRLANVYQLKDYLKEEHTIIGEIGSILKSPLKAMLPKLEAMEQRLDRILKDGTNKVLKGKQKVSSAMIGGRSFADFEDAMGTTSVRQEEDAMKKASWWGQLETAINDFYDMIDEQQPNQNQIIAGYNSMMSYINSVIRSKLDAIDRNLQYSDAYRNDVVGAMSDVIEVGSAIASGGLAGVAESTAKGMADQLTSGSLEGLTMGESATDITTSVFAKILGDTPISRLLGRAIGGLADGLEKLFTGSTSAEKSAEIGRERIRKLAAYLYNVIDGRNKVAMEKAAGPPISLEERGRLVDEQSRQVQADIDRRHRIQGILNKLPPAERARYVQMPPEEQEAFMDVKLSGGAIDITNYYPVGQSQSVQRGTKKQQIQTGTKTEQVVTGTRMVSVQNPEWDPKRPVKGVKKTHQVPVNVISTRVVPIMTEVEVPNIVSVPNKDYVDELITLSKRLAHFYSYRDPATALGFRMLGDELWRQYPVYENKKRRTKQDKGHEDAVDFTMESMLGVNRRNRFAQPNPKTRYANEVETLLPKAYADAAGLQPRFDKKGRPIYLIPPTDEDQAVFYLQDAPFIRGPTMYQ